MRRSGLLQFFFWRYHFARFTLNLSDLDGVISHAAGAIPVADLHEITTFH